MVTLTPEVMKSFKQSKTFKDADRINHLDISSNGQYVVTSSEDENIQIYDADRGTLSKSVASKKYGVDLISFTRNHSFVIHGATKIDDTIRQLDPFHNKYLRYFTGHGKKVTGIKMHPKEDCFLSCSLDHTVRLWDLRSSTSQGLLHVAGKPVASYDPDGLVIAIGYESTDVKLYDVRTFDKGPFLSFPLPKMPDGEWTDLKFNPDTTQILVCTSGKTSYVVDAFIGGVMHILTGYTNTKSQPLEGAFSPDGRFVLMGSTDGKVHVWDTTSGDKLATLVADDPHPITCLKFNPRFLAFVTAYMKTAFWIPQDFEKTTTTEESGSGSASNHVAGDAKAGGSRTPGSSRS